MKKILFASTALVAAGVLTSGTASASDKINLSVGGFSKWWVVGQWNSSDYEKGTASAGGANARSYNNVDVKGDNEVRFGGSTTLDNGMKVGVQINLEGGGHTDATTDTIDRSYVYVEGGFGKFIVGKVDNGTALLHVQAPDAAGNWGNGGIMTDNKAIAKPASVNAMSGGNTTQIASVNHSKVITYVAPTFYGLTVGASYLPTANTSGTNGGTDASRGLTNLNGSAAFQEIYGAGALYANTFGGVGVKVSAGAVTAQYDGGQPAGGLPDSWFEQAYGAQLSYAGFTVGGSWHQQRNNYTNGTADMAALGQQGTIGSGSFGNGTAFDAGVQYASGPYAVSFAYFHSAVAHQYLTAATSNLSGNDTINMYQVSGKYNLGAGVDILASAGYAEYNSAITSTATGGNGDDNHNSGWTVMSGLSLTF